MANGITADELAASRGQSVHSQDGQDLGRVEEIYNDIDTNEPEWIALTSTSGSQRTLVPVVGAQLQGDAVMVPYSEEQVVGSPGVDGNEISQELEARLYSHYGIEYSEGESDSGLPAGGPPSTNAGREGDIRTGDVEGGEFKEHDPSEEGAAEGRADLEDHDEMRVTRSEEELSVGTRQREAGEVRVKKSVETEKVQTSVPKRREEVSVERVPVSEGTTSAELGEDEISVPIVEEEVVVEKKPGVKEELRVKKETVTDEETVTADVRKERVDIDEQTDRS